MKYNKLLLIIAALVLVFGGLFAWYQLTPGKYDALAQCLDERDVTFYGAFWCPHCREQKQLFGKSADLLPYVECSTPNKRGQLEVCSTAGIESYPTWEFADGKRVTGVLTPKELSEQSGCPLN